MRAFLGLLVLGSLFVMAASWQNRMTSELRDGRAMRYGIPSDSVAGPDGWSRLVLGRPSGAEPLPLPATEAGLDPAGGGAGGAASDGGPGRGSGDPPWEEGRGPGRAPSPGPSPGPTPPVAQPFAYIVRDGDSLGEICQKHYDVRPLSQVVDAVAGYNGLASANAIRAGQTLDLPDPVVLFPELAD